MASCTSGQDKPTSALWLATQAGNIELSCLPGLPAISCKLNFPESHYNKVFIDQVWDQVGWILASFCFCEFVDLDSVSVYKHAQKNLANIQPSWPRSWSITHVLSFCRHPHGLSHSLRGLVAAVGLHKVGSRYPLKVLTVELTTEIMLPAL